MRLTSARDRLRASWTPMAKGRLSPEVNEILTLAGGEEEGGVAESRKRVASYQPIWAKSLEACAKMEARHETTGIPELHMTPILAASSLWLAPSFVLLFLVYTRYWLLLTRRSDINGQCQRNCTGSSNSRQTTCSREGAILS